MPPSRPLFYLLLLTGLAMTAFAQKQGIIADAASHAPLPFVNIYSKINPKVGTYSGPDGKFTIPSSIQSDTLVFSLLGYQTYHVATVKKGFPDTLFLHEEPLQLATVFVKPTKKRMVRVGPSSSAGNLIMGSFMASWHVELAALITSKFDTPLYIESIEMYLLLNAKSSEGGYVRVNLYSVVDNRLPGAPLLNRSFLVKVDARHWRGKWHTVDVSDIQLMVPDDGLFVSVEFLPVTSSGMTSRNTGLRFGQKYPLRAVERIGENVWRDSVVQKNKPGYSPLIRLNLSN
ncbi:MAG: carboxypeptidase-like regulatory domain-containing protein [Bacteroidetes bacterium]|nr:carboxypeptidase-like regulatory domain-containing protein [Bacteroidota bacterium]